MASAQLKLLDDERSRPLAVVDDEPIEDRWMLRGQIPIAIRAARRRDAEALQTLVRGLSPRSRYLRFFHAMRELPPELLALFTRSNPTTQMTLLAMAEQDGRGVPVAMGQYVATSYPERCEFAIVVTDGWQRHGIGARLLRNLIYVASAAGLESIEGDVLDENEPMRQLLKEMEFEFAPHPDGAYLFKARKALEPPAWKCPLLAAAMSRARDGR